MRYRFVFGSVNGQLELAFKKLALLHAKTDFTLAIVAGDLFADDDDAVSKLLDGQIPVPVSTYFTVGTRPLPERIVAKIVSEEDICENLHYLGKRSTTKTSEGVRIVALGGALDSTDVAGLSQEQHLPLHTLEDAKALRGANSADILLTTAWPAKVWYGSKVALPVQPSTIPATDAVADLVAALRPRYHISVSPGDFFYEREAFFHPLKDKPSIDLTRFISLASLGNPAKAKAMYAFSLSTETITSIPPAATATPFPSSILKKRPAASGDTYSRFSAQDDGGNYRRKRSRRERSPPPGTDRCFFCLSNQSLPTHMVCSIGNDAYIATAKGPLPVPSTFINEGLDFPGHMIIIPLTHGPTMTDAAMEGEAAKTYKEMTQFRESLQAMVSSQSRCKLGGVTWEINRSRNIHTHWQFLPVRSAMVTRGLVEAAFRVEAENSKLPKLEVKDFGTADEIEGDYFRVWIWASVEDEGGGGPEAAPAEDKIVGKSLVMRFDDNVRFDLQYARKVMAKLMGLENRIIWQDCVQSEEEEKADVEAFRKAFTEWDFTLRE